MIIKFKEKIKVVLIKMNIKDYLQQLRIEKTYLLKFMNNYSSFWLKQELQKAVDSIDIELNKYTQLLEKRQLKELQLAEQQLKLF